MHSRNLTRNGAWRCLLSQYWLRNQQPVQALSPTSTVFRLFHSQSSDEDRQHVETHSSNHDHNPSAPIRRTLPRTSQEPRGQRNVYRLQVVDHDPSMTRYGQRLRRRQAMWKHQVHEALYKDANGRYLERRAATKLPVSTHSSNQASQPYPMLRRGQGSEELYSYLPYYAEKQNLQKVEFICKTLIQRHGKAPDAAMYAPLIRANVSARDGSAARVGQLIDELEDLGIDKTNDIYNATLKALAIHPDPLLRGKILDEMRERWFNLSPEDWHYVVAGFMREGQHEIGLDKFDEMRQQGIAIEDWLYDLIITILVSASELDESFKLLRELFETKAESIPATMWYTVLDAACENQHIDLTRFVWTNRVIPDKLNPSAGHCEQILQIASHNGDADLAVDVFRYLRKRSVVLEPHHYELLIATYAANDDLTTALRISCLMGDAGVPLDGNALWPLKSALLQNINIAKQAMEILHELSSERQVPTGLLNALIASCVELRRLDDAVDMLKQLPRVCKHGANASTFHILLRGCVLEERMSDAVALLADMDSYGVLPDALTFDRMIQVCLAVKDIDGALLYFSKMRNKALVLSEKRSIALLRQCAMRRQEWMDEVLASMKQAGYQTLMLEKRISRLRAPKDETGEPVLAKE